MWSTIIVPFLILRMNLVTDGGEVANPDPLFGTDSPLQIQVETDLTALINDIAYDRDYHRAVISYLNDNGIDDMIPLKIKTRGNFRRGRDNCNFPPFLLNFPKNWTKGTLFEDRNKLKLVTHCVTEEEVYDQYILKEYLVYRLLNQLTEFSFKVRLAQVTYKDSEDVLEPLTRYGIIIEDKEGLAQRINGSTVKIILTSRRNPDYYLSTFLSVFQFMIGNTDWYLPDHNLQLFTIHGGQDTVAIPYDFDLSGLVDPHYSTQHKNYQLSSARERYYLGFCRDQTELKTVIELFQRKRTQLFLEIQSLTGLDQEIRSNSITFLEEFYQMLDTEEGIMPKMKATCGDEF